MEAQPIVNLPFGLSMKFFFTTCPRTLPPAAAQRTVAKVRNFFTRQNRGKPSGKPQNITDKLYGVPGVWYVPPHIVVFHTVAGSMILCHSHWQRLGNLRILCVIVNLLCKK